MVTEGLNLGEWEMKLVHLPTLQKTRDGATSSAENGVGMLRLRRNYVPAALSMTGSEQAKLAAFEGEELFLDRQAAAVAGEFAVAADDAMAGDDDGDGIGSIGEADGARGFGIADAAGEFAVGDGLAVGNVAEQLPDFLLKGRALGSEREVEGFEFTAEVGAELADGFLEWSGVFAPYGLGEGRALSVWEEDVAEAGVIGGEEQRADGSVHKGVRDQSHGSGTILTAEDTESTDGRGPSPSHNSLRVRISACDSR